MGLIQKLFRLQSADGSERCPPTPRTLAELSASLDMAVGPQSSPPMGIIRRAPDRDELPMAGGGNSRFEPQQDDELVFLPPPVLRARVETPLAASLAASVLGSREEMHGAETVNSAECGTVILPPPVRIAVPTPRVRSCTGRAPEHYQPTFSLPCLY